MTPATQPRPRPSSYWAQSEAQRITRIATQTRSPRRFTIRPSWQQTHERKVA